MRYVALILCLTIRVIWYQNIEQSEMHWNLFFIHFNLTRAVWYSTVQCSVIQLEYEYNNIMRIIFHFLLILFSYHVTKAMEAFHHASSTFIMMYNTKREARSWYGGCSSQIEYIW